MVKITKRKAKKCPYCNSLNTIKKGIRKDIKKPLTRYLCKNCKRKFQEKRRSVNIKEKVFKEYFWKKRTLHELTEIFDLNRKTIQKYLKKYQVKIKKKKGRKVNLIIDVVFFSKRKFKTEFGIMVFYDSIEQKPIIWKEVKNERLSDYKEMYFKLIKDGFTIQSVVIDGKKGLREFFESQNIIIQYCHFHQLKTILNYITRKPRLPASKHLKLLTEFLTEISEKEFKKLFEDYIKTHRDFLNEKQLNLNNLKYEYIHKRLRSATRSLQKNIPYLFSYLKYPKLEIQNTTNLLDGGEFSYLKRLLKNHNGCSKKLKLKMINEYFENHKSQNKKRKNRV